MTQRNFELFFVTAVNVLVRPWEGMVRGMKFTEVRSASLSFLLPRCPLR